MTAPPARRRTDRSPTRPAAKCRRPQPRRPLRRRPPSRAPAPGERSAASRPPTAATRPERRSRRSSRGARPTRTTATALLLGGTHHDPHGVLGAHPVPGGVAFRGAAPVRPVGDASSPRTCGPSCTTTGDGFFSGRPAAAREVPDDYRLRDRVRRTTRAGRSQDPYRFLPALGELDLHLIGEGRHEQLWHALGRAPDDPPGRRPAPASPSGRRTPGASGSPATSTTGTAPASRCARSARTGVWELFVPGRRRGRRSTSSTITRPDGSHDAARRPDGPPHGVPARDRLGRARARTTSGRTRSGWRAAATRPVARGAVLRVRGPSGVLAAGPDLPPAGRAASRVRDGPGLHPRRADAGRRAPLRRLLGLPGHRLLRADRPPGHPGRLQVPGRRAAPGGHRRPDGLGARALPARRLGARASSTAARCTSTRTRSAPRTPTGAPWSSTTAARRSATSWSPTPRTGARSSTSTACASTPSPRCSTSTTRARTASGRPNAHGGRENLDAVAFLQEMNATVYRRCPGVVTIAEESTAWDGVTRATHHDGPGGFGGLGFGLKWNMGWMHDSLGYVAQGAGAPQVPPQRDDLLDGVRLQRELRAADLARRGGARQAVAGLQDARRLVAAARQPPRLPRLHVGPPRQATPLHGAGVRPGRRVVARRTARTGGCSTRRTRREADHRGVRDLVRDLNTVYRRAPALWQRDTDPGRLRLGRRRTRREDNVFAFLRYAADGAPAARGLATSPRWCGTSYRLGVPDESARLARGPQHRRGRATAAATSRNPDR